MVVLPGRHPQLTGKKFVSPPFNGHKYSKQVKKEKNPLWVVGVSSGGGGGKGKGGKVRRINTTFVISKPTKNKPLIYSSVQKY